MRKDIPMELELDDGLQFGLGIFETIAVKNSRLVFGEQHLARMSQAASFFQLGDLQERGISKLLLSAYIKEHNLQNGVLKIILTPKNIVISSRSNPYNQDNYQRGFRASFSKIRRNETSPLVFYKTMNYGDNILEKRNALQECFDEKIFLNTQGQICEGSVSNIFFVKNDIIYTPKLSCGLLPGIIRGVLMDNYAIKEELIYPDELSSYSECFVTNSLMGIMPVVQLENYTFSQHKITRQLQNFYDIQINYQFE